MSHTARVAILAGVVAGTVIAIVGTFLWAGVWDALAVVFDAPILVFIIAVVPYATLLKQRACCVIGFEPQPDALAILNSRKSDLESYLPYVVGDGRDATLKVSQAPGMTSLFRPDMKVLKHFAEFPVWGKVVREIPVSTRRLDGISEIKMIDYLKIDAQGSELSVFRNGHRLLGTAIAIQTEVSFLPLYIDQPIFGAIDLELRDLGFIPHTFVAMQRRLIAPALDPNNSYACLNQLIDADIVYVRNFVHAESMQIEQLKHLAIIAHHCYQSYDLAINCVHHLIARGAIAPDSIQRYFSLIQGKSAFDHPEHRSASNRGDTSCAKHRP